MPTKHSTHDAWVMSQLKLGPMTFMHLLRDCPLFATPGEQLVMFVLAASGDHKHGFGFPGSESIGYAFRPAWGGARCNGTSMPWSLTAFFE